MSTFHKQRRRSAESGQAIVLMALAMIALLAFTALAIDGGRLFTVRRTAQNAADMAALAALTKYVKNSSITEAQVWTEIARIEGYNEIPDPGTNVHAWWVDVHGDPIVANPTIDSGSSATAPNGTMGIKVENWIPYDTFIGGIIGQPHFNVMADSIARGTITTSPAIPDGYTEAAMVGGGDQCVDDTYLSFIHNDAQNIYYHGGVNVQGSFGVGSANRIDVDDSFTVKTWAGYSSTGDPLLTQASPYNASPYGNFNFHHAGAQYVGPTSATAPGRTATGPTFPIGWAHEDYNDLTGPLMNADSWRPGSGGTGGGALYRRDYHLHGSDTLVPPTDSFFHTITGTSATNRFQNFVDAYNTPVTGGAGIYWADGDVTVNGQNISVNNATLIVNGKFSTFDPVGGSSYNSFHLGTAGVRARNISVLAGYNPGFPYSCANNYLDAVFRIGGNQPTFDGIIYVPYGQSAFGGNFSAGNTQLVSPGILTYSFRLGSGASDKGNNQQFAFSGGLFVVETETIKLHL